MHPAERRWRGENDDIARPQAIHRPPVRVEANKPAAIGHVDLLAELLVNPPVAGAKPFREDVGHGDEPGRPAPRGQGVRYCSGTSSATTDQGELDGVVFGGVD